MAASVYTSYQARQSFFHKVVQYRKPFFQHLMSDRIFRSLPEEFKKDFKSSYIRDLTMAMKSSCETEENLAHLASMLLSNTMKKMYTIANDVLESYFSTQSIEECSEFIFEISKGEPDMKVIMRLITKNKEVEQLSNDESKELESFRTDFAYQEFCRQEDRLVSLYQQRFLEVVSPAISQIRKSIADAASHDKETFQAVINAFEEQSNESCRIL